MARLLSPTHDQRTSAAPHLPIEEIGARRPLLTILLDQARCDIIT